MVLEPNELVHDTFVSIYTSIMPMALMQISELRHLLKIKSNEIILSHTITIWHLW